MNQSTVDNFEDVTDVGEAPSGPAPRKVDPSFVRNMKIIAGVGVVAIVAVVLIFVYFRSGSKSETAVEVSATNHGAVQSVKMEQTPAMQEMLLKKQEEEVAAAKANGKGIYIPPDPVGKTENVADATKPVSTPVEVVPVVLPPDPMDAMRREGLKRQLDAMFPVSASAGGGIRQNLAADTTASAPQDAARQTLGGAPASGATAAAAAGKKIITALEIIPGAMANPINVAQGKTAFASAKITAGKYTGAYLVGTATLNDEESIDTTLTSMRFGDKSYRINAKVLDETTADAGLRGEIDRRILQRYVLPMTLGVVQGYVTAKSQTGSQVIIGTGGATQANVPIPTEEQAINTGFGVGLQQAQTDIQKEAQKPIRGTTHRDVPMGILFLSDVIEGATP